MDSSGAMKILFFLREAGEVGINGSDSAVNGAIGEASANELDSEDE